MILLGHKEVRTQLRITPAKVERVRYMQEELICPECRKDGDGTIVQAKTPVPLMAHSPMPSAGRTPCSTHLPLARRQAHLSTA